MLRSAPRGSSASRRGGRGPAAQAAAVVGREPPGRAVDVVRPRPPVGRGDHVEPSRAARVGAVAVDAELDVGGAPVAVASADVNARTPPILAVGVPGEAYLRAQPLEPDAQQARDLPGERRL